VWRASGRACRCAAAGACGVDTAAAALPTQADRRALRLCQLCCRPGGPGSAC
jgi:hypothetical protein